MILELNFGHITMSRKNVVVTVVCFIISIISGILASDLIIGGTTLLTGLLCSYFAGERKRYNYIF